MNGAYNRDNNYYLYCAYSKNYFQNLKFIYTCREWVVVTGVMTGQVVMMTCAVEGRIPTAKVAVMTYGMVQGVILARLAHTSYSSWSGKDYGSTCKVSIRPKDCTYRVAGPLRRKSFFFTFVTWHWLYCTVYNITVVVYCRVEYRSRVQNRPQGRINWSHVDWPKSLQFVGAKRRQQYFVNS